MLKLGARKFILVPRKWLLERSYLRLLRSTLLFDALLVGVGKCNCKLQTASLFVFVSFAICGCVICVNMENILRELEIADYIEVFKRKYKSQFDIIVM